MDCPRCGAFNSRTFDRCADCNASLKRAKKSLALPSVPAKAGRDAPPAAERFGLPDQRLPSASRAVIAAVVFAGLATVALARAALYLSLHGYPEEWGSRAIYERVATVGDFGLKVPYAPILVGAIAFLSWLSAAVRDVHRTKVDPSFSWTAGQAVGAFFIPLLNLVKPYHAMRELRAASDPTRFPEVVRVPTDAASYRTPALVEIVAPRIPTPPIGLWWALWIGDRFFPAVFGKNPTLVQLFVIELVDAAAAFSCLVVIVSMNARIIEQRRRARGDALIGAHERDEVRARWGGASAIATLSGLAVAYGVSAALGAARLALAGVAAGIVIAGFVMLVSRWPLGRGWGSILPAVGAATVALVAMGGLVQTRLARAVDAEREAAAAYDAVAQASRSTADLLALDESLATLESVADRLHHHDADLYRCQGRAIHAISHARHDANSGQEMLSFASQPREPAARIALMEGVRDAARRIVSRLDDRYTSCARGYGVPEEYITALTAEEAAADGLERAFREADARLLQLQIEWTRSTPAAAAWTEQTRAGRERERARRRLWPRGEISASPLFEARREVTVAPVPINDLAPPLPAPEGLRRIDYRGPGGKMPAYVAVRPKPAAGRRPIFVVPSNFVETSLGLASALALEGHQVMMPTVRGWPGTAFEADDGFDEISDLAAAREAFAVMPGVDRGRILVVGANAGATRAMLLAAATDRFEAVVAFEPSLEAEDAMRSPLHFAKALARPVFVISSNFPVLADADEMDELAPGKVHAVAAPFGAGPHALLSVLTARAAAAGPFTVGDADIEVAVRK